MTSLPDWSCWLPSAAPPVGVSSVEELLQAAVHPLDLTDPIRRIIEQRPDLRARLAKRIGWLWIWGRVPHGWPAPHFDVEETPDLAALLAPLTELSTIGGGPSSGALRGVLESLGLRGVLLLLGQRLTPASVTDVRAIPPTGEALLAPIDAPHSEGSTLSVGARALAKHAARRENPQIWGVVRGSDEEKNRLARSVVERVLDGTTWWNVFTHFQHDVVCEARLDSARGVRWALRPTSPVAPSSLPIPGAAEPRLIGFVEPHDPSQRFGGD